MAIIQERETITSGGTLPIAQYMHASYSLVLVGAETPVEGVVGVSTHQVTVSVFIRDDERVEKAAVVPPELYQVAR